MIHGQMDDRGSVIDMNLCLGWWSRIIWMGAAPELTNPLRDHWADCEGKHGPNCSSTTLTNYWRDKDDELWVYKLADLSPACHDLLPESNNLLHFHNFVYPFLQVIGRLIEYLLMGKIVGTWSSIATYLYNKFVGIGM